METALLSKQIKRFGPWSLVASVGIWNLWLLWPMTTNVAYPNDASMHELMVRFASSEISQGLWPATHWFPYLNLGSPHFLHYQQLGALIFGSLGALSNPTVVFHWSTYLMISLWPIAIYASSRILRFPRFAAACAAVISPFLVSVPGIGYEQKAYLWVGFGVWAQLCASWMLPFAWAFVWRVSESRRWILPAIITVSLTAALHYETGYLAFAAVVVMPFLAKEEFRRRIERGAVVLTGALLGTSWVIVPLLTEKNWAAVNTYLSQTGLVRGYGLTQDLQWLLTGQTFDSSRLPVITIAVAVGIVIWATVFRNFRGARPVVAMFVLSLLLSFGPTTWGPLVDIIPGHTDIFFRRFLMGVDLGAIYLAGLGVYFGATQLTQAIVHVKRIGTSMRGNPKRLYWLRGVVGAALLCAVMIPALLNLRSYDLHNAAMISEQHAAEEIHRPQLIPLMNYMEAHPYGRVFAGTAQLFVGKEFMIGAIPMYSYLTTFNVDATGFTMRTASLMSQPEDNFNEHNLSDYGVFGVRYLLLPLHSLNPVRCDTVMKSGPYRLCEVPSVTYLSVVQSIGTLIENRSTIGPMSVDYLHSQLFLHQGDFLVHWGSPPSQTPINRSAMVGRNGTVTLTNSKMLNGEVTGRAKLVRPSIVTLSASYDPGWHAFIDGKLAPVQALAPAIVGVEVPKGIHTVEFIYVGYAWYPELVLLSLLGPLFLFLVYRCWSANSGR